MSIYGFARGLTRNYLKTLNAGTAVQMVRSGATRGYARGWLGAGGSFGGSEVGANLFGLRRGATGAAKAFRGWAWPTRGAGLVGKRAARIGTVAGAGLLAGNVLNPKNNWGPF